MKSERRLAVVIVAYNGEFWLKKTLTTLKQYYLARTKTQVEVYVVDNASSEDITALIQENFSWVHLITSERNLGFAGANNLALRQLGDFDYVMLLNPDTQFDERSDVDGMLDYLATHPEVGMIGPKLVMTDGRLDPACHRGEPTLWASFCYFAKLEKLFPRWRLVNGYHRADLDLNMIHRIDAISGAAMIVTRQALADVGFLDDNFFLYAEDLDWARRFRDAGYAVVYDPEVTIIHHKNKTGIANKDAQISGRSRAFFYDTMLQYYDKYDADRYPRLVRSLVALLVWMKKMG